MKKQVIVTLTKVYKREVEREVSAELIEGMTDEEIQTFLMEEWDEVDLDDDGLFEMVELIEIPFEESAYVDTDRFDIYDGDEQVYGGHL
jgi:hypothetical protein